MPTICLNMIVKDEAHVIVRCLEGVKPLIDHWVIVDTGSSDGTQDLIREALSDVPGELHERVWVNFGHNRSEAIALAEGKADYILTIDADEMLKRAADFVWPELTEDAYLIEKRRGTRVYRVKNLVKDGLGWRWVGVLHEYIECDNEGAPAHLDGIMIYSPREGARARDPLTYRRDALLLEQALLQDPDNTRDVFYLAQSYRDCGDYDLALRNYVRRVELGGWVEEVFISLLNIARIGQWRGEPWPPVLAAFLDAHQALPGRAEPLYDIGMEYARREAWSNAWLFLSRAAEMPRDPEHVLFVEDEIYQWRARLEAAVAAYWTGRHAEAVRLNEALLSEGHLPERLRAQVEENLRLSL